MTIRGITFGGGFADVTAGIDVTAKGCWIDECWWIDEAADENYLTPIKATSVTDNNADGLRVTRNYWNSLDAAGLEFIEINADLADLMVGGQNPADGNIVVHEGTNSPLVLFATGKDMKGGIVGRNFLSHKQTSGNLFMSNDTASPNNRGIIAHNRCRHADVTGAHVLGVVGGCGMFDNLSVSTDALSGFVLPAIDVDS